LSARLYAEKTPRPLGGFAMFPAIMSTDAPSESTGDLSSETSGSRLLTRLGIGSSVLVHIAVLAWIVFGTGVRLYNPSPTEAIAVELVTPEEAKPKTKDKPDNTKEKKNDTLSQLDLTIPKPTMPDDQSKSALSQQTSTAVAASKQSAPAQQQQAAAPPPPPPQPTSAAQPSSPPPQPQPASAAQPSFPPPPPPPAPQQTTTASAANAPAVAQPDIGEKYGAMFGLSDAGFSPDTLAAKIDTSTVTTFRAHLRKCLQMPASVTADDKVRIVLRVALSPEGNLMASPALIEASASPKGPLLMQGAIKALQACQPYDMLPVDKYKEWRVLDLSFTPRDFGAG
jgi:hypothetical protein